MTVTLNYQKRKNASVFNKFENHSGIQVTHLQNYIPIYKHFFSLNENNYNSINLNHTWFLNDIKDNKKNQDNKENENIFTCKLKSIISDDLGLQQKVFFKMAPLLDPFKYIIGKYNINDRFLFNLPKWNEDVNQPVHSKITDMNNSSYVDGLFVFLSGQLLNEHKFLHGVDYYGSFLGIKENFKLNVFDDLDYLIKSEFFNKNKNTLFKIDDYSHLVIDDLAPINIPITIHPEVIHNISVHSIDDNIFENVFQTNSSLKFNQDKDTDKDKELEVQLEEVVHLNVDTLDEHNNTTLKSSSTCSSRTSHTHDSSDMYETDSNASNESVKDVEMDYDSDDSNKEIEQTDKLETDSIYSDSSDIKIDVVIPKFPVQVICMENCENTFDDLIIHSTLSTDEWFSAFMQIIMTLLTYQKVFSFTHNDLHTNNIMYNKTNQKFIYYLFNKKYYKVPTFGRIYKIIDFGRAIYKFKGKTFCSDSFQAGGDASTQYNTEPYFNDKKPRLEPNFSFDLCRLACSIFDYVIDDFDNMKSLSESDPVVKLIVEWCLDDNGINVLYKNNGSERYPDFKLYKMIARCVHNHTPVAQLDRPEFKKYIIEKNAIPKNTHHINIDEL